jgi:hypothetical protein
MEARKQEITVHKNVLAAQLRSTEEEKHLRAKELAERKIKVEKLRNKYQLLLLQISPEGEQEEHSQAYFIIKAAQVNYLSNFIVYQIILKEKEELMQQRDALNEAIVKTEQEISSLQYSLTALNTHNQRLHTTKTRGGMTPADFEQSQKLERVSYFIFIYFS